MSSYRIGIIGGSGLYHIEGFTNQKWVKVKTPFGAPSDDFLTGKLALDKVSLLAQGEIREIHPGPDFIHSLFHLDRPSTTIAIRTYGAPQAQPQYSYRKPHLAVDPFFREETLTKKLQTVSLLLNTQHPESDSMIAALETLQALPCKGRRVAVLGEMAEQGAQSEPLHEEVGRRAAELGVMQLFAVGRMAAVVARGARAAGLTRILEFADVDSAAAAIKQFVKPGDLVLLKASRVARLERVGEWLRMGGASN